nr:MAG TPA: hypothetical protein [Caudoviricetes sp.]
MKTARRIGLLWLSGKHYLQTHYAASIPALVNI